MVTSFKALSLSYTDAPVGIREQFTLTESECKQLLATIQEMWACTDLLILSTCNRTEIYYSAETDLSRPILALLCLQKGVTEANRYHPYFRLINESAAAIRHLFSVAAGLASTVVGDLQIAQQVKQAYQWAVDVQTAGPFLHRLMHTIFWTNKRITQETGFRSGAASVAYATVELIELLSETLTQPNILLLGVGDIGKDVCKNLAACNFTSITLINRTASKAEAIAGDFGFRLGSFEDLTAEIQKADIVVSSVQREKPIITRTMLQAQPDTMTYQYFIDLAVPRSIEQTLEELPGITVYNIDELRSRTDTTLQKRVLAIPQVKQLVEEGIGNFTEWSDEALLSPTIQKLKESLEQIRKAELARHLKYLSPEETDRIEQITTGIIQKIIKRPVLQLKAACKRGNAEAMADVLQDLFVLETQQASPL